MNGASKILTVSYGTFSCTLEGFEDPFNTMKAIAEYFRDLASEDRYFGAEPPTPDAAMLHRIAEREIQRRVEAKIQDNGVILRAEETATPRITMPAYQPAPVPQAPAPAVSTMEQAAPAVESAAIRLARLRAAQTQIVAPHIMAPAPSPMSDLAARFADVEAYAEDQDADTKPAAAPVHAAGPIPGLSPIPALSTIPALSPINVIEPVVQAPTAPAPLPVAQVATPEPEPPVAPVELKIPAVVIEPPVHLAPTATTASQPEAATIATPADTPAHDPVAEAVRDTLAGLMDQDDQLADDIAKATIGEPDQYDAEDAGEAEAADAPAENLFADVDEDYAADLTDLMVIDDADFLGEDDFAEAEIESQDLITESDQPASNPILAAFPEADEAAYSEEATAETAAVEPGAVDTAQHEATPALSPVAAESLERARARVIKVRRLDTMTTPISPVETPPAAALTAEAEASLQSELDALEAEIAPTNEIPDAELVSTLAPDSAPMPSVAEEVLPAPEVDFGLDADDDLVIELTAIEVVVLPEKASAPVNNAIANALEMAHERIAAETADAAEIAAETGETDGATTETHKLPDSVSDDADRLLAQTNTALEVPETKRRRSAIAHLKAAVLATVAERRINPNAVNQKAAVRMDPYRKDLDKVMRPPAPAGDRPAPLVLVSAQRIDRKIDPVADAARPVPQIVPQSTSPMQLSTNPQAIRPRRVTANGVAIQSAPVVIPDDAEIDPSLSPQDMENLFAGDGKPSFGEFADSLGATSMSELIEAAGAYCTLILGRPSFTRPLLFQQISSVPKLAEVSREDGLRGFGRLLREGRIQKAKRGQYAMADASPILIEAKRLAS
ncbi:MAG: hypothetical protein ABIV25_01940 [Paracoccaceae bacterium]